MLITIYPPFTFFYLPLPPSLWQLLLSVSMSLFVFVLLIPFTLLTQPPSPSPLTLFLLKNLGLRKSRMWLSHIGSKCCSQEVISDVIPDKGLDPAEKLDY